MNDDDDDAPLYVPLRKRRKHSRGKAIATTGSKIVSTSNNRSNPRMKRQAASSGSAVTDGANPGSVVNSMSKQPVQSLLQMVVSEARSSNLTAQERRAKKN